MSTTLNFHSQLGQHLKALRKQHYPRDDQRRFATRIGVSRATYQKMEKGDLSISIGSYYMAAQLLQVEMQFNDLFLPPKKSVNLLEALNL